MSKDRSIFETANWSSLGDIKNNSPISWMVQQIQQQSLAGIQTNTTAFRRCLNGRITPEGIVQLLNRFQKAGGRIVSQIKYSTEEPYSIVLMWQNTLAEIVGDHQLDVVSTDEKFTDELFRIGEEFIKNTVLSRVYVVTQSCNGPGLTDVGDAGLPLTPENYSPGVVDDFQHIVKDLQSEDPCGRISIFDGPPGTGKTYLVRSMTALAPTATFVILPSELVSKISGPSLIQVLINNRRMDKNNKPEPMILIIEDADGCLVPRGADNIGALSSLLNTSDGILGSVLNLRIVATTNAGHLRAEGSIDEAVLRPGRLCRRIHVNKLEQWHAARVYERLTGKSIVFQEPTDLATIYRLAKDAGYKPSKTLNKIGFSGESTSGNHPQSPSATPRTC